MRNNNGIYTIIGSEYSGKYESIDEFINKNNIKICFEKKENDNSEKTFINNLPTKHNNVFDIDLKTIPSYTKRKGSLDRYAAGYYSVDFGKSWVARFCPRISTLEKHEWSGPYNNKAEAEHTVKLMNEK